MEQSKLRKKWETRIASYKASGLSGAAWCAENQVNVHQFYYWIKRLKTSDATEIQSSKWLSLEVSHSVQESTDPLLIKVGEITIEVKPNYDSDLLLQVVRTLQTLC